MKTLITLLVLYWLARRKSTPAPDPNKSTPATGVRDALNV